MSGTHKCTVVYYVQYYLEYVYPALAKVAEAICKANAQQSRRGVVRGVTRTWTTPDAAVANNDARDRWPPLNAQGAAASWDARRGAAAVGCSAAAPHRDSAAVLVPSRQHIEREHRGRWRSVRWRYRPHQRRSAPPASCSQCATERLLTGCLRLRAGRDHHPDGGQLRLPERSRMPLGRHLRRAARRAPLHSV